MVSVQVARLAVWVCGEMAGLPRLPVSPPRRTGARTGCLVRLREREALFDAVDHGLVDLAVLAELALALRALARSEMAKTRLASHDLPRRGHFEPLGDSFLRLATCDGSWHGARKVAVEVGLATTFSGGVEQ